MSLVWISKPFVLHIEEKAMSLSVVYQCICTNFCHSRSFFQPIFVRYIAISHALHSCTSMFQVHVAGWNLTLNRTSGRVNNWPTDWLTGRFQNYECDKPEANWIRILFRINFDHDRVGLVGNYRRLWVWYFLEWNQLLVSLKKPGKKVLPFACKWLALTL